MNHLTRFWYWLFPKTHEPPKKDGSRITGAIEKPSIPPRKTRKKFKRCLTMDKIMYTRDQAVSQRLRLSTKDRPLRFYKCEFCPAWHLTHKKNYL